MQLTLEQSEESGFAAALQMAFLVPRKLYLTLHCERGDTLWALLKPPQLTGELWMADEVQLLN